MDVGYFLQIVAAIIFGNAVCFAFFMGAMEASRQTKKGTPDDKMPWWVYACLIVAPLTMAVGMSFAG